MRTLWNVVSFLAVVHVLALGVLIGWLWQTQRLNGERVSDLRRLFSTTVPEAQAAAQKSVTEMEAQRLREIELQKLTHPPMDSAAQLAALTTISQQEHDARRRLADEQNKLRAELDRLGAELERRQETLDRDRKDIESDVQAAQTRKGDEQFLRTVKQFEQISPRQGKRLLVELVNENQLSEAVAYLDAMSSRSASRILKEFKTDEEVKLATELLEQWRTLGHSAPRTRSAPSVSENASHAATADQSKPLAKPPAQSAATDPG